MKKLPRPKKAAIREDRIHSEAIADANGPEEQVMEWLPGRQNPIPFPGQVHRFQGRVATQERGNRRSPAHGP
jgi:hypothetical protein